MKRFLLSLLSLVACVVVQAQTYTYPVGTRVVSDDGVYTVAGPNLITNPDFADGLAGWKSGNGSDLVADNFEVQPTGGPDGGPCLKALGGAGSGSDKSIKTGWAVETGKTYVFSVWAYRTQSGMSSNTQYSKVCAANSDTGTDTQLTLVNYVGDQWTQTEYVFTADKPYVVANLGWLNAASSFAHFTLAELAVSAEVNYTNLENAIAQANELLASTTEGDGRGQYKTAVRATLQAAITTASAALSATTQTAVNDATTVLKAAITTYKNNANLPFRPGVGYTFLNVAAQKNLTSGDGTVRIATPNPSDKSQEFYFVPTTDDAQAAGYNLVDGNGVYIFCQGSWDTKSSSSTDLTLPNAIFNIIDLGDRVQIKNMGSGSVLGVDGTEENAAVWSNKNGTADKYCWVLSENTPTAGLLAAIATAQSLLDDTEVGTAYYQVPQSAHDTFAAAIATARAAVATVVTFDDGAAAVAALTTAQRAFDGAFNPLPDFADGQTYAIRHSGTRLLTAAEGAPAKLTAEPDAGPEESQIMTFETTTLDGDANVYLVRNVQTGLYLARTGNYNTLWTEKSDTLAAVIEVVRASGRFLGLKFVSTQTHLGSDLASENAECYSDKALENNQNAWWSVELAITVVLDRDAFNAALAQANEALAAMQPGYLTGEYFAEDIAAFRAAIAARRSAANKSKDQQTLDTVTAGLLEDIAAYQAKVHTRDYLDTSALRAAIATARTTLQTVVAGDCEGQYPKDAIDACQALLDQAVVLAEDESASQADIDALAAQLTAALTALREAQVHIDYSGLDELIATAKKMLADQAEHRGDAPGCYPEAAFTTLQGLIDAAAAVRAAATTNQEAADAASETLEGGIEAFELSFIPNDYTALQTLVDEAAALIEQARKGDIDVNPDYLDDLIASYGKNAAALEAKDQNVVNRAVKMLQRDIDVFKHYIVGIRAIAGQRVQFAVRDGRLCIDGLPAGAAVQVYNAAGRLVASRADALLPAGVYAVRITAAGQTLTQKVAVR